VRRGRWLAAATVTLVVATAFGAASIATSAGTTATASSSGFAQPSSFPIVNPGVPPGAQRLHYEVGPITVTPGQNSISLTRRIPQPAVDGWIVGMRTNLRQADGSVPAVSVIHLHHGVWLNLASADLTAGLPERFFAAGEEKTVMALPPGYGYQYKTTDRWLLNWMLHNNLSDARPIWITYDIDLLPAGSPNAQGLQAAHPVWMDVQNGSGYPVFDVLSGSGTKGAYTYPDQANDPYKGGTVKSQWTVPKDGVLLGTAGHVHPGGLFDDLWVTRKGASGTAGHVKPGSPDTAHLFRSVASYWEPAGKVSWDFAATGTPLSWRPAVHKGDVLSITSTYDSKHAWYESMGIMVVWMAEAPTGGVDPFQRPVDVPGVLTHGHLAENNQHGGKTAPNAYTDLRKVKSQDVPSGTVIPIVDFSYQLGDMSGADSVPAVPAGGTLTFRNDDASKNIYHTITACAAPCDLSTGIAYPIANAKIQFDSAELGHGGAPASGSVTWSVPRDLPPGTYTYFCRIHPFMRGGFRVLPAK
jgi:plastocyanin